MLENQRKSILSWWGVSELLDVVGSPGWTRTSDILINRRGPVMSQSSPLPAILRVTARPVYAFAA